MEITAVHPSESICSYFISTLSFYIRSSCFGPLRLSLPVNNVWLIANPASYYVKELLDNLEKQEVNRAREQLLRNLL